MMIISEWMLKENRLKMWFSVSRPISEHRISRIRSVSATHSAATLGKEELKQNGDINLIDCDRCCTAVLCRVLSGLYGQYIVSAQQTQCKDVILSSDYNLKLNSNAKSLICYLCLHWSKLVAGNNWNHYCRHRGVCWIQMSYIPPASASYTNSYADTSKSHCAMGSELANIQTTRRETLI
jgi:hypothetical protein